MIWRQDCYQLPTGRTSFGFKDGIGQPAIEGSGIPPTNTKERPLRAGEIILGYPDETGDLPPMPSPDVLGRNGTYIVFRKLHTRVAAYRQYLRARATTIDEEALLGAKMVGRWQSGAPLGARAGARRSRTRCRSSSEQRLPLRRRPARLQVSRRLARPPSQPAGRAGPRGQRQHPAAPHDPARYELRADRCPEGVLDDDGADRGIMFVFAGAHLHRQFEFVKTQWLNDGIFIGAPAEKDPLVGPNDGSGTFTIAQRPIRRRLTDMPPFVVTRGGEYCFAPGLRALRWLAELDT